MLWGVIGFDDKGIKTIHPGSQSDRYEEYLFSKLPQKSEKELDEEMETKDKRRTRWTYNMLSMQCLWDGY